MAINTLAYAQIFQKALDKQILQEATSNFLEVNAGQVIYNGGDTVKIPVMSMDGLGTYDRNTGYVQGGVTLNYEDFKMTQDRGRKFQLDAMDVNESNFVVAAGTVMGEFQRTKVIPEIDSYRWSKIYSYAKNANHVTKYTPAAATILDALKSDITAVEDIAGDSNNVVIVMPFTVFNILSSSSQITRMLTVTDFTAGSISTKVKQIDGVPIIPVASSRMKTVYDLYDGSTSGQTAGGLVADSTATQINWLVFPRTAPIAVSKTDVTRIFDPMTNQDANAWRIDYRKYHDIWIPTNKLDVVYANAVATA